MIHDNSFKKMNIIFDDDADGVVDTMIAASNAVVAMKETIT